MTTTQAPIKQDQRGWFVRVNDDGSLDNLSGSSPVRLPLITITDPTAIRMAAFLASRRPVIDCFGCGVRHAYLCGSM